MLQPCSFASAAAKTGVDSLTRTCAVEFAPYGVRVNAIAPGAIGGTEGMSRMAAGMDESKASPLGKMGKKGDIANAVLFFVSDAADFVTGQVIAVCGGSSVDMMKLPLKKD